MSELYWNLAFTGRASRKHNEKPCWIQLSSRHKGHCHKLLRYQHWFHLLEANDCFQG